MLCARRTQSDHDHGGPNSRECISPGNVWTSAGITAGIDLALALIEEDHGFAIAKGVAQHLVVYHRRHGGQSQFAASVDLAPKNNRISAAVGYARDHITEALTLERLADAVGMSRRQFSRAFRAQTGTTPARVVERLRADLARGLCVPTT